MKPRSFRNVKLLMLLLCFNLCLSPNAIRADHYDNRADFEAAISSFTNIDFEGIAEQSGQAYPLDASQFADYGVTIDLINSVGTPSVGEPAYPPETPFWQNFYPTSNFACMAPDNTSTPTGVTIIKFDPPVMGVGANFLDVDNIDSVTGEKITSKILVHGYGYDEYWEATGEGDQFIGIVDPSGRIEIAFFYIGYKENLQYPQYPYLDPDGAAIDDLIIGQVAIEVEIDIKPGSDPNPINQGSNGLVPVAIFSSTDFDATTVVPESVSLGGAEVAVRGKGDKYMAHEEDVDGDGLTDLVVQVETEGLDEIGEQGEVILTGETTDGKSIEGYDVVVIVPPD